MITDFEILLKPISEDSPAGKRLQGFHVDKIRKALEEDLSGAAHGGMLIRAKPEECGALAIEKLSTETKDLYIAVWLTEALVRIDGFDGLRRGLDLTRELLTVFWDTVYPLPEDGDEEIRAAPLVKLTGKGFTRVIEQMIPITKDGFTRLDEQILQTIPLRDNIGSDDALAAQRREAEEKKRVLPENFAESLKSTDFNFYAQMSVDITAARKAIQQLEDECRTRFTDPYAVPQFESLAALFDPYEELAEEMRAKKAPQSAAADEPLSTESPEFAAAIPEPEAERQPVVSPVAFPVASEVASPVASEPLSDEDAAQRVFAVARYLRRENPANPAAFLLPRCWHFGQVTGRGSVEDADLEPPPAELRKELWRLNQEEDWNGLIGKVETAMELRCASAWMDLQYYAGMALQNLGGNYEAAHKSVCDLVRQYVTLLPDLSRKQLLDGTPAASPATARWLESLAPAGETPWERRPDAPDPETGLGAGFEQPTQNDCFEASVRLAESGRITEALKAFYEGQQAEDTGRGRFESRLRVASLCITAGQHALSLPALRELRREIKKRCLEEWDPELAARALSMLYECLLATGVKSEETAEMYARICVIDPLLAVKLGDRK